MTKHSINLFCWLLLVVSMLTISGCGSSGSLSDGKKTYVISLELIDGKSGAPTNIVSEGNPGILRVTVTLQGKPVGNYFVILKTDKGSFLNSSDGSGITDASGVAVYTLAVARTDSGAGKITVTLEDDTDVGPWYFTIGEPVAVKLGTFLEDGTFLEGKLASTVEKGEELSVGGTAKITATLAYLDDNVYTLYDKKVDVTFSTECVTAVVDETVSSVNGSASTTYRADGCSSTRDVITATAVIDSQVLTASAEINLAKPATGSIEFVSATPDSIAILGVANANHPSTSIVRFLVKDELGNPVPGERVNFELTTTIGGLTLSPASADTNNTGNVQAIVTAGRVPTSVRVKATVNGTMITNLSDRLSVNTGLPDQNSFSLSAATLNPEAWNYDGETVVMTVRAADDFNNPVPDGTAIAFVTEGGYIVGTCLTADGACSATWTSSNPRPDGTEGYLGGEGRAGRVTILATALGQESFQDRNGSGLFEADGANPDLLLTDMPEAFLDTNENGLRNTSEWFLDYDADGLYDQKDSKYNGLLCNSSTGCTSDLVHVRDDIVITMSTSFASITAEPGSIRFVDQLATYAIAITVADLNGNSMPYGTTVEFKLPSSVQSTSQTKYTIGNTTEPQIYYVSLAAATSYEPDSIGYLLTTVTTPKNNVTTYSVPVIAPPYIGDTRPEADFEAVDFSTPGSPYQMYFQDKTTVNGGTYITSWFWDFGDTTTANTQNAVHNYAAAGKYLVKLTVTNNRWESDTVEKIIDVVEPEEELVP